ncbi:Uncharacterized protein HZ326_28207, partial [Fusarium oxysporum f. sp. albedinis]
DMAGILGGVQRDSNCR